MKDSPALIFGDCSMNYADFFGAVSSYAAILSEERCSKVAICLENRPEWLFALYAGWKIGCSVVPVDSAAPPDEAAFILEDCRPEVVFCSRLKRSDVEKALRSVSYVPRILVFEECAHEQSVNVPETGFLERDDEETALIVYTSGTTGTPKGAMLSFGNILANVLAVSEASPIFTPGSRTLVLLPVHHILPLVGTVLAPLFVGGTCVFSPSMASEDILKTLENHRVNIIVGVPRFYSLIIKGIREKIRSSIAGRVLFALAKQLDSAAFSRKLFGKVHRRLGGNIRYLVSGGAAIDEDVARDFKALGFNMLTGYGMTEAAPMISFTRPGTLRIGASGQVSPANEVRIVDGEILARGKNVMRGYYNRRDDTEAMVRDGWLHTGDLGFVDSEGFLFVTGRKKDIIVLPSGKNVNPEEVESRILGEFDVVREIALCLHDDVLHAVILPDFARLAEKGVHALDDYFRWNVLDTYNQKAAPAKKIMKFTLVREELPKTRLGKIRRFRIPSLIAKPAVHGAVDREPETPVYHAIRKFLSGQTGKPVFGEAHLEIDMGMDSLDKVAFSAFLHSSFGVKVHDEELLRYPTAAAIAEYVERMKVKMEEEGIDWSTILHANEEVELPGSSPFYAFFGRAVRFLLNSSFRMSASGLEHIPKHPFMLVANHQSYLDSLAIASFLDTGTMRRLYFYAGERHFRRAWQQAFAARHNIILVDINRRLKLSLQKMAKVLKEGRSMILFPEGTRSRDGTLQAFKKTFAILSRELDVPIVPVALRGAYEAMPRGRSIPKFGQAIHVDFLPPMYPGLLSYDELTERVYARIKERLETNG